MTTRKQLVGLCGAYDIDGAIARFLCELSIERHLKMQELTRIGVDAGEDGGMRLVQISLIECDLCRVFGKYLFQTVALDRAPVLGVDALALPQQGIAQIKTSETWSSDDDSVRMSAEQTVHGGESQRLGW